MKKVILPLLLSAMLISTAACGGNPGTPGDTTAPSETTSGETTAPETEAPTAAPIDEMALSDIMTKIQEEVVDLPGTWEVEINQDNFKSIVFTDYKEGYEALCTEAMINVVPHSVVLLRVPEGTDAEAVASEIRANADPNKWICVGAEKVVVRQYGSTIALIMSFEQTANQIITNFDKLNGSETPEADVYTPQTGEETEG